MSNCRVSRLDVHETASLRHPERSNQQAACDESDDPDALMKKFADLCGAFEKLFQRSPHSGPSHGHSHSHSHSHSPKHWPKHLHAPPDRPSHEAHPQPPAAEPPHPPQASPSPASPESVHRPPGPSPQTEHAHSDARTLEDAQRLCSPQPKPVLRGDEKSLDDGVKTQADFGRLTDCIAKDYGLDANLFRAQINAESGVFDNGDFRKAMQAEGDLDRRGENNTSIGLGQISRKFLDGREWSGDGPGNPCLDGGQVVTTEQYTHSPSVQLRMAACNLSQRISKYGGLEEGLAAYVSGNPDPNGTHAQQYLENIERGMKDPRVYGVGR